MRRDSKGGRRNDRRFNFVSHYYKSQFYKRSKVILTCGQCQRPHAPKNLRKSDRMQNKFCERKLKIKKPGRTLARHCCRRIRAGRHRCHRLSLPSCASDVLPAASPNTCRPRIRSLHRFASPASHPRGGPYADPRGGATSTGSKLRKPAVGQCARGSPPSAAPVEAHRTQVSPLPASWQHRPSHQRPPAVGQLMAPSRFLIVVVVGGGGSSARDGAARSWPRASSSSVAALPPIAAHSKGERD